MERGDHHTNQPTGLQDYVRVVRRYKFFIVAVAALFVGASLFYSSRQDEVYASEAALSFQEPGTDAAVLGASTFTGQTVEQRAAIGARTVTKPEIVQRVAKRVDLTKGDIGFGAQVEARTSFVVLGTEANDPRLAATVANVFAEETVRQLRTEFREEVDRQLEVARDEFRTTRRFRDNEVVVFEQRQRLAKLRSLRRLGEPVVIARRATASADPISPKPVRNGGLGLIAGLTLALILAFAREALDRRLRTTDDIRETSGLPVIGHIRNSAFGLQWLGSPSRETEGELAAFNILRTNLDYLSPDAPLKTVLVTSSLPEEGKTTVSISLAVAAAMRGERALLIGCDLRRPALAQRLGVDATPGLSDYLAGRATPQECVQTIKVGVGPEGSTNGAEPDLGGVERRFALLPGGEPVPNPTEMLRTQRFAEAIAEVSAAYDCVILDSPPLLPVADSLEVAKLVDGVVLCVRATKTTRDELRAAKRQLEQLPDTHVAIAVTGLKRGDEPGYGYSYYSEAYG